MGNSKLNYRYCIETALGKGGMGTVYLALDEQTGDKVAIKKAARVGVNLQQQVLRRLQYEYAFLSTIDHPNVVKARELFCEKDTWFLVLEFVPGISLNQFIARRRGQLSLMNQLAMAVQMSRGVEVINAAGIVHRDIKTANIMIDEKGGVVKLIDLGIGKSLASSPDLTKKGMIIGSYPYMSPEQIEEDIAANSDVFSLAVVLYQFFLWEKHSPFQGANEYATIYNVTSVPQPPLYEVLLQRKETRSPVLQKTYRGISRILQNALQKNSAKRTASAKILADQLHQQYDFLVASMQKREVLWNPTRTLRQEQMAQLQPLHDMARTINQISPVKASNRKRSPGRRKKPKKAAKTAIKAKIAVPIALIFLAVLAWQGLSSRKIEESPTTKDSEPASRLDRETPDNERQSELEILAIHYIEGKEFPQDYAKARQLFLQAGQLYSAKAMHYLGFLYETGQGGEQDKALALKWYSKAAKMGYSPAMERIGDIYTLGTEQSRNYHKAREWFSKAAAQGSTTAMYRLGLMHEKGRGGPEDYLSAIEWYGKAAERGDLLAMGNLGVMYYRGTGIVKDYPKAFALFAEAARRGDGKCMYNLAVMYEQGLATGKDERVAAQWYHNAANTGISEAMHRLFVLYTEGRGVVQSRDVALSWLRKAAAAGNQQAIEQLQRFSK